MMRKIARIVGLSAILLTCCWMVGCGRKGPTVAPVEGIVTLDGKPVDAAGVLFSPLAGGPSASGTTDAAGHFRLTTGNLNGATLGKHSVVITKSESVGVSAEDGDVSGMLSPNWKLVNHLPSRYASAEMSGLSVEVQAEDNVFPFKLSSK